MEDFFIGSNADSLAITFPPEALSDALKPQIKVYSYSPNAGYRERIIPQRSTALDLAFYIGTEMALSAKYARIHTWTGNGSQPFTDGDHHYPLQTLLNEGDVVYFESEYTYSKELKRTVSTHHAQIEWFSYVNSDLAKIALVEYFKTHGVG